MHILHVRGGGHGAVVHFKVAIPHVGATFGRVRQDPLVIPIGGSVEATYLVFKHLDERFTFQGERIEFIGC